MEKFIIYGYPNPRRTGLKDGVVITSSEAFNEHSTFEETLRVEKHGRITLSFSFKEKGADGKDNPFLKLLSPESVIGLYLPERRGSSKFTKLKVTKRTPSFYTENIIYNIVCEDFASRVYSKQAQGFSIDATGSLNEIAEDILGQTRKNTMYKNLNRDISNISYHNSDAKKRAGYVYDLPYVSVTAATKSSLFGTTALDFVSFMPSELFVVGEKYELHFDVVTSNAEGAAMNFRATMRKRIAGLEDMFPLGDTILVSKDKVRYVLPFTYEKADLIYLKLSQLPQDEIEAQSYNISLSNFKITKSHDIERDPALDSALYYVPGPSTEVATFSVSNSTLYGAIVSLGELFGKDVLFDYLDNSFTYIDSGSLPYTGLRLDPSINLNSLARPESSTDFVTVMHIEGGGDIDSAIPTVPVEWRRYLESCVVNKFSTPDYMSQYKQNLYSSVLDKVYAFIETTNKAEIEAKKQQIRDFAEHMDKIPVFESTIYDFSYFLENSLMTPTSSEELSDVIWNKVRKLNVELNVYTYKYYEAYSDLLTQMQKLAFYSSVINTERKFQYDRAQQEQAGEAPKKYTSAWISFMNGIDASKANLAQAIGEVEGMTLNSLAEPGGFTNNVLAIFGYKSRTDNAFTNKLIPEISNKINQLISERSDNAKKIAELESQKTDLYSKEAIDVEIAGLVRRQSDIDRLIGGDGYEGVYNIELSMYNKILETETFPAAGTGQFSLSGPGYYDMLYNVDYDKNIVIQKEKELELLMDNYESYALEGRYQNGDSPTPKNLLEQALNAYTKFNRPMVEYSISALNIAAIDGYEMFTHPEVGDKISIAKNLYKTYEQEETSFLVVHGYRETLRDPSSLDLEVKKDDEADILVRRMLENSNFVTVGNTERKSDYALPVPTELSNKIPSVEKSLEDMISTGFVLSTMFSDIIK